RGVPRCVQTLRACDVPEPPDRRRDAELLGPRDQCRSFGTVAGNHETDWQLGIALAQSGERVDQIAMALLVRQPSDEDDDAILRRDADRRRHAAAVAGAV